MQTVDDECMKGITDKDWFACKYSRNGSEILKKGNQDSINIHKGMVTHCSLLIQLFLDS